MVFHRSLKVIMLEFGVFGPRGRTPPGDWLAASEHVSRKINADLRNRYPFDRPDPRCDGFFRRFCCCRGQLAAIIPGGPVCYDGYQLTVHLLA